MSPYPGERSTGREKRRSPEYERLRKRLKEARKRAGLTQREVAIKLGRNQTYVWKSEIGERRVDAIELKEFAEVYGVPIALFYK